MGRVTEDHITHFATGVDTSIDKLTYGYDSAGNANRFSSYNGSTLVNQVSRTFNGFGQVASETQTNGTNSATVNYTHDESNAGRLTAMQYPNGRTLSYNYASGVDSSISRLTSISDSSGTLESYGYLGDSTALAVTRGNGVVGTTTLDPFGNVQNLKWSKSGTAIDDFTYTYDANDNVLSKYNGVIPSLSELYAYDKLNRLTTFNRGTLNSTRDAITTASTLAGNSRTWTLDPLGNQSQTSTDGTSTTNSSNHQNQLKQLGSANLDYDANGNQTTDESGNTLKYDAWNRLVEVKNSSGTTIASFSYDALGRRITETEGGTTTTLLYSTAWQVIEERQGSTVTAQNVWSPTYIDAMVCRDVTAGGTTTRYWFQHDANFNTTSITDNSGNVLERYVYDPYGSVTILNADGSLTTSTTLRDLLRYLSQGRRFDPATGTYDSRERVYDPATGTWKQADPAGTIDGQDIYQFALSSPINSSDPSGLFVAVDDAALLIGIGALVGLILGGASHQSATGLCKALSHSWTDEPVDVLHLPDLSKLTPVQKARIQTLVDTGQLPPEPIPVVLTPEEQEAYDLLHRLYPDVEKDAPSAEKNSFRGVPGSTSHCDTPSGRPKQSRRYGPDGYPETDTDYDHDHGQGQPHVHDWGRPPGGGPPTDKDRGVGRSPKPGDPKHPKAP